MSIQVGIKIVIWTAVNQAYLDMEFQILFHVVDVGEDVSNNTRNDTLHFGIPKYTLQEVTGR